MATFTITADPMLDYVVVSTPDIEEVVRVGLHGNKIAGQTWYADLYDDEGTYIVCITASARDQATAIACGKKYLRKRIADMDEHNSRMRERGIIR